MKSSGAHLSDFESCEWFSVPMNEEEAEGAWNLARTQPLAYVQLSIFLGLSEKQSNEKFTFLPLLLFLGKKKPYFSTWLWHLASASAPSKAKKSKEFSFSTVFFSAMWDGANPPST